MKVRIEYEDSESLVGEEVVQNLKNRFDNITNIEVFPDKNTPVEYISFAIKELITIDHIELILEYPDLGSEYTKKLKELKRNIIEQVDDIFDSIAFSNEERMR